MRKKRLLLLAAFTIFFLVFLMGCMTVPERVLNNTAIGFRAYGRGDFDEASKYANDALKLDASYYPAYYLLENASFAQKNYNEAVSNAIKYLDAKKSADGHAWAEKLKKIDSRYCAKEEGDVYRQLTVAYFLLKKYENAIQSAKDGTNSLNQNGIKISDTYARLQYSDMVYYAADSQLLLGQNDKAETNFITYTQKIDDKKWAVYWRLSEIYCMKKDKAKCLSALKKMVELNSKFTKDTVAKEQLYDWIRNDADFKNVLSQ